MKTGEDAFLALCIDSGWGLGKGGKAPPQTPHPPPMDQVGHTQVCSHKLCPDENEYSYLKIYSPMLKGVQNR